MVAGDGARWIAEGPCEARGGAPALAAVLAAEAADLDILWGLAGQVEELKHHRGITHTFWAVPVVAGAAVGHPILNARQVPPSARPPYSPDPRCDGDRTI